MKCPVCPDATLLMSARQGVEIDYCPTCRGVWLDRGELDKLIQMSDSNGAQAAVAQRSPDDGHRREKTYSDFDKHRQGSGYGKKSWLWEIFD